MRGAKQSTPILSLPRTRDNVPDQERISK